MLLLNGLLNPGGYLAIADLFPKDGSFHGEGFGGHLGFNPAILEGKLFHVSFKNVNHHQCYVMTKEDERGIPKSYPIFLLTAFS
jgi:hypothetical protein